MADKNKKLPGNVPGKFYVDEACTCVLKCIDIAPKNFKYDADTGNVFVDKQPETTEDEKNCREAMLACPVGAIGDDGL